jgi:hypothetical protein
VKIHASDCVTTEECLCILVLEATSIIICCRSALRIQAVYFTSENSVRRTEFELPESSPDAWIDLTRILYYVTTVLPSGRDNTALYDNTGLIMDY